MSTYILKYKFQGFIIPKKAVIHCNPTLLLVCNAGHLDYDDLATLINEHDMNIDEADNFTYSPIFTRSMYLGSLSTYNTRRNCLCA